jgi:putative transposase
VLYHFVWGTKYRRKILKPYVRVHLVKSLIKVQKAHPDWYIQKVNTAEDHVHLLMEFPPKYAASSVAQELKRVTSRELQRRYPFIKRIYERKHSMWATGYFVSTVGLNESLIQKYIQKQNEDEVGRDITAEFE